MGEGEFQSNGTAMAVADALAAMAAAPAREMRLVTPGGRYQVRWDEGGSATALERGAEDERPAREAQLAKTTAWMDQALAESTREALVIGWILDIDTTIKLLYGHQDGAEISYNPTKPGRPSHVIHTYWIANLRLVLDAEVQAHFLSLAWAIMAHDTTV